VKERACCDEPKVCHYVAMRHYVQLRYLHCIMTCNVFVPTVDFTYRLIITFILLISQRKIKTWL
jgi:hypothetical protein